MCIEIYFYTNVFIYFGMKVQCFCYILRFAEAAFILFFILIGAPVRAIKFCLFEKQTIFRRNFPCCAEFRQLQSFL